MNSSDAHQLIYNRMMLHWDDRRDLLLHDVRTFEGTHICLSSDLNKGLDRIECFFFVFECSSQAGSRKSMFSFVCLGSDFIVSDYKTVLRCLSVCTLPF